LLEDFSIHYAPSAGVLGHTLVSRSRARDLPGQYAFVSNPAAMPAGTNGKALSPLPGADEEVRRIVQ
jgi:hypothetical protein